MIRRCKFIFRVVNPDVKAGVSDLGFAELFNLAVKVEKIGFGDSDIIEFAYL